jgi:hypothetical protein
MPYQPYKRLYEFSVAAKDNVDVTRPTDRAEDKRPVDEKIATMEKWLKSRNIKIREIYVNDNGDLVIQIAGGGTQYNTEIRKALQMVELDQVYEIGRARKYTLSQSDDYKYTIPASQKDSKVNFNLFNGRDSKI